MQVLPAGQDFAPCRDLYARDEMHSADNWQQVAH